MSAARSLSIAVAVFATGCFVKAPSGRVGAACDADTDCVSVSCQEGVCCDTSCVGPCQACSAVLTGGFDGVCAPVLVGLDPRGDCIDSSACDGAGGCRPLIGGACERDDTCPTGFCRDQVCCAESCDTTCFACSATRTGVTDGICRVALAGSARPNECTGAAACDGTGSCFAKNAAASCINDFECVSGACRDGVCCGSACAGICLSCSARTTGNVDGACASVMALTDPLEQCPGGTACDGNGACYAQAVGSGCADDGLCASGYCRDGVCCSVACDGVCEACSATTSGSDGTCGLVALGLETADECVGAPVCDGGGGCVITDELVTCTVAGQCTSGVCCDGSCRGGWVGIGPSLATGTLRALFAESATSVYAGGDSGLALRFDGDQWLPIEAPVFAGKSVNAIDGESGSIVMVGSAGFVAVYDGTGWTALPAPVAVALRSVAVVSATRIYTAGDSAIYVWDGNTWSALADSTDAWRAMWRRGGEVFAGSASGAFATVQGSGLARYAWPGGRPETPATVDILGGAALSSGEHLVVTGMVERTNGVTHTTELNNALYVAVAVSGEVRFAAAANGTFARYEGSWTSRSTGLTGVVGLVSSDACSAFGLRGREVVKY